MKKIVTVIGARPQFIKAAPVSRVIREKLEEVLVDTGQHYDFKMAGVFFEELNIPKPDYNLGVGSGPHGEQTGEMLGKIEEVLLKENPVSVLTYGDTNSTLSAALAASKLNIPIFHVEAGLRSFNRQMPEEINRVLTDHVSNLLFAPTETAIKNLKNEGIVEGVYNVGDVMYDAFLYNLKIAEQKHSLTDFGLKEKGYILATIHRAENTNDKERLRRIFESITRLDKKVIIPIHPRTEKHLREYGLYDLLKEGNIQLIEPVSYLEMLLLQKYAKYVITDSGGVQKEAYFAKVPCFTMRDQTEWTETVEVGWNTLINPKEEELQLILQKGQPGHYVDDLYGTGNAAGEIVERILSFLN